MLFEIALWNIDCVAYETQNSVLFLNMIILRNMLQS